jgi:hypothetical protein
METFFTVCYQDEGDDFPIVWCDHDELAQALASAEELLRILKDALKPPPQFVWVEHDEFRFNRHGERGEWCAALAHVEDDGSEWFAAAPEGCELATPEILLTWWTERHEHAAEFCCAWCGASSRQLEPLMRDVHGPVYHCRACREWTDSLCEPEPVMVPYQASRSSALAA